MIRRTGAGVLAVAISIVVAACGPGIVTHSTGPSTPTAHPSFPDPATSPVPGVNVDLTVFGAASLRGAFGEISHTYPELFPGTTLTVTTDSSTTLATQIELGARADVFLSADTDNPRRLVVGGHAEAPPVPFARNLVVVVVAEGNPLGIEGARDLARPGLRIIAAGPDVPITRYANQLIDQLSRVPGFPPDFAAAYEANVVSREENVAAVVAKMQLGVGDAAIVYQSDASHAIVQPLELPNGVAVWATYEGVVLAGSDHREAAWAFLEWLAGPVGQEILWSSTFEPP